MPRVGALPGAGRAAFGESIWGKMNREQDRLIHLAVEYSGGGAAPGAATGAEPPTRPIPHTRKAGPNGPAFPVGPSGTGYSRLPKRLSNMMNMLMKSR